MTNEALSQDEVDALLHGFSDDASADEDEPSAPEEKRLSNVNLAEQKHLLRKRMHAIEGINDRFAQLLRVSIASLLRGASAVSSTSLRVIKYGEFLLDLATPTNLNLVALQPLRGTALFICDPKLIFAVVDNMFGGTGKFHAPFDGRSFTKTEQRIIQRLVAVILSDYQKAWEPVYPLQFKYVRSEMHTTFADVFTPSDVVIVTSLSFKVGDTGGDLEICIPYAGLEPIRDLLDNAEHKDERENDGDWRRSLSREIQSAEVNLVANFASIPISLGQVLQMKPGDIIQFNMPKAIGAEVDGVPIFECRYGTSNGKYAVKIERVVAVR
jgi:flagellar motor switch protein FliM